MCTVRAKVPSLDQFLSMNSMEILKLPVNDGCQPSELYKPYIEFTLHGISHQINSPVTSQILALKYFVNIFQTSHERAELFDVVIPKLKESLSELLQSTQLDEVGSLISSVTLALCDTVESTSGNSIEVLQSLAIGVLDLLLQVYKLTYQSINDHGDDKVQLDQLERIVAGVNDIRSKLFDFLISNERQYVPDNFTNGNASFINTLILLLCGIAEFAVTAGDLKCLVAVWRCITTFCFGKLSKAIDRLNDISNGESNCFEFLLSAVKTGCVCIRYCLQDMSEGTKMHIKTIAFTTSILQRLAVTYPHDKFKGHDHILTTLLLLMRTIRTQTNEHLNQSLALGLQNVLLSICKCDEFVESFHRKSCDEHSVELLRIALKIGKKLDESEFEFLKFFMKDEDANIVDKILECVSTDPSSIIFTKNDLYSETVKTLSQILIKTSTNTPSTVNPDIVPRLLVKNTLRCNNVIMGYILIDLWSEWIRCLSEEQCFNLTLFWSEMNDTFSIVQPKHLPSVHAKLVLRVLYDRLSESWKLKLLSSDQRTFGNKKLGATLGLQGIQWQTTETTDVHAKCDELLKEFLVERSESALYKLIEHLRSVETESQSNSTTSIPHYLIELWDFNLDHMPNKYSALIIPLIRISIGYQRSLNNGQHLQILRKLIAIVRTPNIPVSVKLEVVQYLRHVVVKYFSVDNRNEILTAIRQLFHRSLIDSDPIVRKATFIAYAAVMGSVQHDYIQPDHLTDDVNVKTELIDFIRKQTNAAVSHDGQTKFLQGLSSYSIQHQCIDDRTTGGDETEGCVADRDNKIKEIIDRMQSDVRELMELNQKNRLKDSFCKDIATIRTELASLK